MTEDDDMLAEGAPVPRPLAAEARKGRLRARDARHDVPVLRVWETGFAVALEDAGRVGGRVDLYDGARFLCRALVVASDDRAGERRFEFKYATHGGMAPPRPDYAPEAPEDDGEAAAGEALPAARLSPLPT